MFTMTLTTADLVGRAQDGVVDPTDPSPRPKRRTFTAAEKAAHLDAYDALPKGSEERGAYLRREGLYSSHLTSWRRQREEGSLAGLAPKQRGRKATPKNPLSEEVARLERENKRLLARAERAERLVELQKKVAELLGDPLPPPPAEPAAEEEPLAAPARRRR